MDGALTALSIRLHSLPQVKGLEGDRMHLCGFLFLNVYLSRPFFVAFWIIVNCVPSKKQ